MILAMAQLRRWSSPRAWGCFYPQIIYLIDEAVFPTCVGVFLAFSAIGGFNTSLPHVRGGVS